MKFKISLTVAAVFLLAASSLFAAIPPAENLLPTDTLAVVTVPDFSTLRAASAQSSEWLLWNDPAIGIEWPLTGLEVTLSDKDKKAQTLEQWLASPNAVNFKY